MALMIGSVPHYQHQNFAEHWIQQLEQLVNTIMDSISVLPNA